jgi:rhodanese-related sulfurtransferase
MTKEEFKAELLDGLTPPPAYFPQNVMMNINGYESLDTILKKGDTPLSPKEFEAIANQTEALILDVRNETEFVKEHIPSSIFIGLHGQFAPWVGALIRDTKQPILLVTPEGLEVETITRLSRVGFDNTLGYLKGGLNAWKSAGFETDKIDSISPEGFASKYENAIVVDARKPSEYKAEHVESAVNIPLDYVNEQLAEVPKDDTFFLHCAGGYRSVIMASILKARGYHNMINVEKGMSGIRTTNVPLTAYVCPSTLK